MLPLIHDGATFFAGDGRTGLDGAASKHELSFVEVCGKWKRGRAESLRFLCLGEDTWRSGGDWKKSCRRGVLSAIFDNGFIATTPDGNIIRMGIG